MDAEEKEPDCCIAWRRLGVVGDRNGYPIASLRFAYLAGILSYSMTVGFAYGHIVTQDFCQECNINHVKARRLRDTYFDTVASVVSSRIHADLKLLDAVVIIIDGYSHANRTKAMGIVYRAITPDFRLIQHFLDLIEIRSSQDGTFVAIYFTVLLSRLSGRCAAELLEYIIRKRIDLRVGPNTLIAAIVTDNGSNYKLAAARLSGDSWPCVAHTANLVFKAIVGDTTTQLGADMAKLLVRTMSSSRACIRTVDEWDVEIKYAREKLCPREKCSKATAGR